MAVTKKVRLEGNSTVWAYVLRDGEKIAHKHFEYIFTSCVMPWREDKALEKAYLKANKWADKMIVVENNQPKTKEETNV